MRDLSRRAALCVKRASDLPFSALSNDLTRDPGVSFAAKGFALWLFGLPSWEHDAMPTDTDVARRAGLHLKTVQTYLGQLQDAGFARRETDGWTLTDDRETFAVDDVGARNVRGAEREFFAVDVDPSLYKNNNEQQHIDSDTRSCVVGDVERVFDAWVQSPTLVGRPARRGPVLTAKRRALIRRHLADGYSVETLIAAVQGWTRSEFHRGRNESGKVFDALELLLRDAKHVDDMAAAWHGTDASVGAMTDAEVQARALAAGGTVVTVESAAAARTEWDALIGTIRDLTAGLAEQSLHPDFVAVRAALRDEFKAWRAGHGRAPTPRWRETLAAIPVTRLRPEPTPVSDLAVLEASAALQARMAELDGPIHRQPTDVQLEIGRLNDHARNLKAQRAARMSWESWAKSHADELAKHERWASLRAGIAGHLTEGHT